MHFAIHSQTPELFNSVSAYTTMSLVSITFLFWSLTPGVLGYLASPRFWPLLKFWPFLSIHMDIKVVRLQIPTSNLLLLLHTHHWITDRCTRFWVLLRVSTLVCSASALDSIWAMAAEGGCSVHSLQVWPDLCPFTDDFPQVSHLEAKLMGKNSSTRLCANFAPPDRDTNSTPYTRSSESGFPLFS